MIKYKHLFLKETFIMLKVIKFSSIFIVLSIFTACAGHKKAILHRRPDDGRPQGLPHHPAWSPEASPGSWAAWIEWDG